MQVIASVPPPPSAPPPPPISPDGLWWWDGSSWLAIPASPSPIGPSNVIGNGQPVALGDLVDGVSADAQQTFVPVRSIVPVQQPRRNGRSRGGVWATAVALPVLAIVGVLWASAKDPEVSADKGVSEASASQYEEAVSTDVRRLFPDDRSTPANCAVVAGDDQFYYCSSASEAMKTQLPALITLIRERCGVSVESRFWSDWDADTRTAVRPTVSVQSRSGRPALTGEYGYLRLLDAAPVDLMSVEYVAVRLSPWNSATYLSIVCPHDRSSGDAGAAASFSLSSAQVDSYLSRVRPDEGAQVQPTVETQMQPSGDAQVCFEKTSAVWSRFRDQAVSEDELASEASNEAEAQVLRQVYVAINSGEEPYAASDDLLRRGCEDLF